jgi:hypothetical protein
VFEIPERSITNHACHVLALTKGITPGGEHGAPPASGAACSLPGSVSIPLKGGESGWTIPLWGS